MATRRRGRRVSPLAKRGRVELRGTDEDIERWFTDAENRGLDFSQWARLCLDSGPMRFPEPTPGAPVDRPRGRGEEVEVAAGREGTVDSGRESRLQFESLREQARDMAVREGRCTADVARGTRCKLCGKVH